MPLDRSTRPTGVRGDIDNYIKAALDAIQADPRGSHGGGAIGNDRMVEIVTAVFHDEPGGPQ